MDYLTKQEQIFNKAFDDLGNSKKFKVIDSNYNCRLETSSVVIAKQEFRKTDRLLFEISGKGVYKVILSNKI